MIDGFKLRITSNELRSHCCNRAAYHQNRAEEKQKTLPELKKSLATLETTAPEALAMMNKTSYHSDGDQPVKNLERDIRAHRNKALVFDFYAEHLFDEDYTLEEHDLQNLEILRQ